MGRIFRPMRPVIDAAGHPIIAPDGKVKRVPRTENYYIRVYDANGKAKDISTGSPLVSVAKRMLHDLESAKGKGEPIGAHIGKITFDDAAKAVIADHKMNARRSTGREQGRIDKHLTPYFTGRRMINIAAALRGSANGILRSASTNRPPWRGKTPSPSPDSFRIVGC